MAVKTMDGYQLDACDVDLFRHKEFYYVVVSGSDWNICDHMLLNVGGLGGYYVHVATKNWTKPMDQPYFMRQSDYDTYLAHFGKKELERRKVFVPFPDKLLNALEKMASDKWNYHLFVKNCANFAEAVLRAGGANFSVPYSCPRLSVTHE